METIEIATRVAFRHTRPASTAEAETRADVSPERPRWYMFDLPFPGPATTIHVALRAYRTDASLVLDIYDARRAVIGHGAVSTTGPNEHWLDFTHRGEHSRIYVNVRERYPAAGITKFDLLVRVLGYIPPNPVYEHPPCDPRQIDRTNPRCEGVSPPCQPNDPDFTNPNCCSAMCSFERGNCRARVYDVQRKFAKISLGLEDEIVIKTPGEVIQSGNNGARFYVVSVNKPHEAEIMFSGVERLDLAKLARGDGTAVLSVPEPCKRRH